MRKNGDSVETCAWQLGNLLNPISGFLNVSWGQVSAPWPAAFLPILSRLAPAGCGLRAGRPSAIQLAPPVRIDAAQLAGCASARPGAARQPHQVLRDLRQARWLMLSTSGCPCAPCCRDRGVKLGVPAPAPALLFVDHDFPVQIAVQFDVFRLRGTQSKQAFSVRTGLRTAYCAPLDFYGYQRGYHPLGYLLPRGNQRGNRLLGNRLFCGYLSGYLLLATSATDKIPNFGNSGKRSEFTGFR
jgi:hypothetical protein